MAGFPTFQDAMTELVVGADVGGTSTKVAVADRTGAVRRVVRAAGANPNAVGRDAAAVILRTAVDEALRDQDGVVRAMVVGMAGGSRVAHDPDFLAAIRPDRLDTDPVLVSDLAVAFASGTAADEGYVLVAGTGAVAGHVRDGDLLDQRDGWGWLLGDEGAGFWLGREAVRATLRAFEEGTELGPFHRAVLAAAGVEDRLGLVQQAYARPSLWLASLAGLVSAFEGSGPADAIAVRAAEHLGRLVEELSPTAGLPIVLAGSVATAPGPVSRRLRGWLATRFDLPLHYAGSGLVGALWTAQRRAGDPERTVHQRLVAGLETPADGGIGHTEPRL